MKRIYLAGPMSGKDKHNFPAFFAAASTLEKDDSVEMVFNPAQNDIDNYGDLETVLANANYRDCLRQDLDWICRHATHMAMLPGWEDSKGARVEYALATALDLEIILL